MFQNFVTPFVWQFLSQNMTFSWPLCLLSKNILDLRKEENITPIPTEAIDLIVFISIYIY